MTPKRKKMEDQILKLMSRFDGLINNNWNVEYYKKLFASMSDKQFDDWAKKIANPEERNHTLKYELNPIFEKNVSFRQIEMVSKEFGVPLCEYIVFPHKTGDVENPMVSKTPVLILSLMIRKLQQMLDKKNSISGDISSFNPITRQVTNDSKATAVGDMQINGLVASNNILSAKEFLNHRSDNEILKRRMYYEIETSGECHLHEENINPASKQSLNTVYYLMRAAGFKIDVLKKSPKPESTTK